MRSIPARLGRIHVRFIHLDEYHVDRGRTVLSACKGVQVAHDPDPRILYGRQRAGGLTALIMAARNEPLGAGGGWGGVISVIAALIGPFALASAT